MCQSTEKLRVRTSRLEEVRSFSLQFPELPYHETPTSTRSNITPFKDSNSSIARRIVKYSKWGIISTKYANAAISSISLSRSWPRGLAEHTMVCSVDHAERSDARLNDTRYAFPSPHHSKHHGLSPPCQPTYHTTAPGSFSIFLAKIAVSSSHLERKRCRLSATVSSKS